MEAEANGIDLGLRPSFNVTQRRLRPIEQRNPLAHLTCFFKASNRELFFNANLSDNKPGAWQGKSSS